MDVQKTSIGSKRHRQQRGMLLCDGADDVLLLLSIADEQNAFAIGEFGKVFLRPDVCERTMQLLSFCSHSGFGQNAINFRGRTPRLRFDRMSPGATTTINRSEASGEAAMPC